MLTFVIVFSVVLVILYFIVSNNSNQAVSKKKVPVIKADENNRNSEELYDIKVEENTGNSYKVSVNLNEEEFIRRAEKGTLSFDIKKTDDIYDISGFFGSEKSSPNGVYQICFSEGYLEDGKRKRGKLALIKNNKLVYKKSVSRPNDCLVSNDGIVICCDWINYDGDPSGRFIIFDSEGNQIFTLKTRANLGLCAISEDSQYAVFETHNMDNIHGDKLFIIDVPKADVIKKLVRPCGIKELDIYSVSKEISILNSDDYEVIIDFEGRQTNIEDYENQVRKKGNIRDVLSLYNGIPQNKKFSDPRYIELINKAVDSEDKIYGLDQIFRNLGEFYEEKGDIKKTVENWEIAIKINPKVGVKRRLTSYKKGH
ncbi:hypothetical protein KZP23_10575 [Echinicola marina]|uniref:hypothetical protein n=1 Tax=Echinicola marina TaxID=2859768 RepID=UPI001CF6FFCE|nr:hypothetical protein [Echinicola marina]UCS95417.1 hypothetical protein KZP23_10575 [Echinicola marina]